MAISPPSDILLDVAKAADPAKVRAATDRLAKLATDPTMANDGFSKALSDATKPDNLGTPLASVTQTATNDLRSGMRTMTHGKTDAYQKFEALMLQNFMQNMLPDSPDLYGDKMSAGAFRSMLAEQLANQIAKAGGIGIAKAVEAAHPAKPHGPLQAIDIKST